MLFRAEVKVTLKKGVLDPQGSAVEGAVRALGYGNVPQVRIGKLVEMLVEANGEAEARRLVDDLAKRLLSNPVLERYSFDLKAAEQGAGAPGGAATVRAGTEVQTG
jgi:phosphoribosylformylglycinamidine synthase subunit PurS